MLKGSWREKPLLWWYPANCAQYLSSCLRTIWHTQAATEELIAVLEEKVRELEQ